MKKNSFVFLLIVLLLASLACQALGGGSGGGNDPQVQPLPSTDNPGEGLPPAPTEESGDAVPAIGGDSEFPLPDDATTIVNVEGTVNYQTKLSLDEVLKFYRDYYTSQGYTERELLTTVSDGAFSIVFDGDPSGQSVVIQGFDLGDGSMNINISLRDV